MQRIFTLLLFGLSCLAVLFAGSAFGQNSYTQNNLVTDPSGSGPVKDSNLVNPWGICIIPGDPFWVADNASTGGVTSLYNKAGMFLQAFTVAPPAGSSNPATPTGCVGNVANTGFNVTAGGTTAPSLFIFDTEDGTISGWNGTGGSTILKVDNSQNPTPTTGAVYKGLALLTNKAGTFLLATNFRAGKVEAYDTGFNLATSQFSGGFTDTNPPAIPAGSGSPGYAPFGIHIVNNQIMVTYALQTVDKHDPMKISSTGYVDVFDPNTGAMLQRIMDSHMNAPWGVVIPPASFGSFGAGGDLLVGNFGDGTISAYTFPAGAFVDQMKASNGTVIVNPGLWDLVFDSTGMTGDSKTMYFTTGGANEMTGLFAAMTVSPATPPASPDFSISASPSSQTITAGQTASFTVTVGSLNGFNSSVSLACSGQQINATCILTPSSGTPASGGTFTSMATIATNSNPYAVASAKRETPASRFFALAVPVPLLGVFGLLALGTGQDGRFGRRTWRQRLTGGFLLIFGMACFLGASGCGYKRSSTNMGTQRSTNMITITATSGSLSHTATVSLTVQ